jgi:hypothetical protein
MQSCKLTTTTKLITFLKHGILRDSSIAMITPIRDGMNLVAKEYVACQIDDPGVLILSPFTGLFLLISIIKFKNRFLKHLLFIKVLVKRCLKV